MFYAGKVKHMHWNRDLNKRWHEDIHNNNMSSTTYIWCEMCLNPEASEKSRTRSGNSYLCCIVQTANSPLTLSTLKETI
jgi:hypothetical protein